MQRMNLGPALVVLWCVCLGAQTRETANAPAVKLQPLPVEIQRRSQTVHAALKSTAAAWVTQQAKIEERRPKLDRNALETAIRQRFGGSLASVDVDALIFAVLAEAAQDQETDLQSAMNEMQALTQAKQSERDLLNAIDAEIAAAGKGATSAKCSTAFCRTLPAKLAEIGTETDRTPKPVRLQAPPNPTYAQLSALQAQLNDSMNSLGDVSQMTQTELQTAMQQRSQFIEMMSNLMKSTNDTSTAIISNLK